VTDKSAAEGEKCGSTFLGALGIPGADCLDPVLQPLLTAVDSLLGGDPTKLVAAIQGLPNTLPAQLAALPTCLSPASSTSSSPSPSPVVQTTSASGAATTDPTTAVPVSATPTFTG
jgi:hypothetical protein